MKSNPSPFREFLSTPTAPDLGPGPRTGVRSLAALNRELDAALGRTGLTEGHSALVRATLLLWHDHLDAAHTICQDIETADGSYVHAILHRREPDYGNARYWFRRVGRHSCFAELAARVTALIENLGDGELAEILVPGGQWDSFAFVDACEAASRRSAGEKRVELLRKVQQAEFEVLLEYLAGEA